MPKTSIIILTYNNLDYTKQCIESIRKYTKESSYEIIVIDNASTDATKEYLQQEDNIKVLFNKENKGFPIGCNQGIKLAHPDNDILLLNNDTIVTTNWLDNLKTCLYSSEQIGAVGPICNQNENLQGANFTYDNLDIMQDLASKNNISNPSLWEEKVFLIGYCLLIKNKIIKKLKALDENYSPGYIEDNDLSLRIVELGYKLILCHDTFIHHFLGTAFRKDLTKFYQILYKNREYFYNKWHFNTLVFDETKQASFPLINNPQKILDLNSSIGVNILKLKYTYQNIIIDGVEEDPHKRNISQHFATIYRKLKEAPLNYYDYILIGTSIENCLNINDFLIEIKKHLTANGYLIGEFTNASNIKKLSSLLAENCLNLYKTKNIFSKKDIITILEKANYENINFYNWYEKLSTTENNLYEMLKIKYPNILYTYYTFKAQKKKILTEESPS